MSKQPGVYGIVDASAFRHQYQDEHPSEVIIQIMGRHIQSDDPTDQIVAAVFMTKRVHKELTKLLIEIDPKDLPERYPCSVRPLTTL